MGAFVIEDAIYAAFPFLKVTDSSADVIAPFIDLIGDSASRFLEHETVNIIATGLEQINTTLFSALDTIKTKFELAGKTVDLDVKWIGQYLGEGKPPKGVPRDCKYATARMINRYIKSMGLSYKLIPEVIPNTPVISTIDKDARSHKNKYRSLNTDRTEAGEVIKMIDSYLDMGLPVATLVNVYGRKSDGTDHWVVITGRSYSPEGKVRYAFLDPGRSSPSPEDYFEIEEMTGNLVKPVDGQKKRYRGGPIAKASYEVFGIFPHKERMPCVAMK